MNARPTRRSRQDAAKVAPKLATPGSPPVTDNALRQPQTRWQRTTRYAWDKGGSKGGR